MQVQDTTPVMGNFLRALRSGSKKLIINGGVAGAVVASLLTYWLSSKSEPPEKPPIIITKVEVHHGSPSASSSGGSGPKNPNTAGRSVSTTKRQDKRSARSTGQHKKPAKTRSGTSTKTTRTPPDSSINQALAVLAGRPRVVAHDAVENVSKILLTEGQERNLRWADIHVSKADMAVVADVSFLTAALRQAIDAIDAVSVRCVSSQHDNPDSESAIAAIRSCVASKLTPTHVAIFEAHHRYVLRNRS